MADQQAFAKAQAELDALSKALEAPKRPVIAIVGGAKVSEMHCNFLINDRNATAEDIDAGMAEKWGWVNRIVADPVAHSLALAIRIATFPPNAVREAKESVLRNDTGVEDALLEESAGFNRLLGDPRARTAMTRFLERGGQTVEGESRVGELAGELGD